MTVEKQFSPEALKELKALLGNPKQLLTQKEDLIPYSFDGTATLEKMPVAVAFPHSTEEVAALMKWAIEHKCPIVSRGSGTGLSGGSVPSDPSVVVCLTQLNRILEVDSKNLTLLAESGCITQSIFDAAAEVGLFYPPDPGSMKISTIGGNVAENSGGLRGLKYGVTRDYIMGLEVVMPDASVCWLGNKCVKDVAGYSLKDIFIGSEGTLGIITKVLIKLLPQPASRQTLLATYSKMEDAAATVSAIIEAKIIPCTLEFLDNITINCVEDFTHVGLPRDAAALLLMETDGHPQAVEDEIRAMASLAKIHNATTVQVAKNAEEAQALTTARRSAFSALARVSPTTILEDATVPRSELVKMIRFISEVGEKYSLRIGTFGHMGDGNLHPTFLTDETNHEEMERVEKAMVDIFDYAISLGGTITGEHGVGTAKKAFLPRSIGSIQMRLLRDIKKSLDPHNLLNPGKIFDA